MSIIIYQKNMDFKFKFFMNFYIMKINSDMRIYSYLTIKMQENSIFIKNVILFINSIFVMGIRFQYYKLSKKNKVK